MPAAPASQTEKVHQLDNGWSIPCALTPHTLSGRQLQRKPSTGAAESTQAYVQVKANMLSQCVTLRMLRRKRMPLAAYLSAAGQCPLSCAQGSAAAAYQAGQTACPAHAHMLTDQASCTTLPYSPCRCKPCDLQLNNQPRICTGNCIDLPCSEGAWPRHVIQNPSKASVQLEIWSGVCIGLPGRHTHAELHDTGLQISAQASPHVFWCCRCLSEPLQTLTGQHVLHQISAACHPAAGPHKWLKVKSLQLASSVCSLG